MSRLSHTNVLLSSSLCLPFAETRSFADLVELHMTAVACKQNSMFGGAKKKIGERCLGEN